MSALQLDVPRPLAWPGAGRHAPAWLQTLHPSRGRSPRISAPPARLDRPARLLERLLVAAGWLSLTLAVALAAGAVLTHPGRVAVKTVLLLPDAFPDAPARPLHWITAPPRHEEHGYAAPTGQVEFDLYLPASRGRHDGVILYTGAFGLRRDPSFVRFAEALARSGAVVMVPESSALRDGEIDPREVEVILQAIDYLRGRPEVDPARIGIMGFSVGGSLVLLAAEDEVGREQIAWVNVFGAYFDAREMLLAVASHEIEIDGQRQPWEPAEVAVYAFARQLIGSLPDPTDCEILGRAYLEQQPEALADADWLSPDGRLVRELFERPSRERAAAILDALPQATRDRLAAVSPSTRADRLKTRLYVMHGRADQYIPVTHARALVAAAPPGTVRRASEFELFGHVLPDRQVDAPTFVAEVLRFFCHACLVGQEYL